MSTANIEYSGGGLWHSPEQFAIKTRHAPRWWQDRAAAARAATLPTATPARPRARLPAAPAADARRVIGWLAGTICPAVSDPAHSARDGRTLPEQFTDECMHIMRRQTVRQEKPIPVTWGHGGPVIATTRNLDVLFHVKYRIGFYTGLEFEARLRLDDELHRRVLADAADGLGVSIGYYARRQSIVERDGVGEVRVVHDAVLDHVAVLPPSSTLRPCFPAARCYAGKGAWQGCPVRLHDRAHLDAYAVWKRQAGVTV